MCKIGAVILAAGQSKRMGKSKLLLPYKDIPIIMYPLQLAVNNHLEPIVCVTGREHEQIQQLADSLQMDITVILNPCYTTGMASSLKVGIQTIKDHVDAVLIFLGDQPLIPKEAVQTIMEEYQNARQFGIKIIRPLFGKRPGHPILFDRSLLDEFDTLQGDEGGRSILHRHKKALKIIQFQDEDWGIDIDTEKEYRILLKRNEEI